jgi:hypothetical protein
MYELYFDSQAAFFQALESEAGQELMAALVEWDNARLFTWFYSESWDESAAAEAD